MDEQEQGDVHATTLRSLRRRLSGEDVVPEFLLRLLDSFRPDFALDTTVLFVGTGQDLPSDSRLSQNDVKLAEAVVSAARSTPHVRGRANIMSCGEAWGDYDSFVSPIPNDVTIEEVMEMDSVPLSVRAILERRHTSRTTVGAALADEEERKARAKAKSIIAPGAS